MTVHIKTMIRNYTLERVRSIKVYPIYIYFEAPFEEMEKLSKYTRKNGIKRSTVIDMYCEKI